MLSDEEKNDILFQIDMQLYDEFNDKFCEMNDNLGTFYTYKDIEDLEKLEKETEIKLLREAIKKQSKEIEELKIRNNKLAQCHFRYEEMTGIDLLLPDKLEYTSKDKIKAKIEEINKEMLNEENSLELFYRKKYCKEVLQSLLEKE